MGRSGATLQSHGSTDCQVSLVTSYVASDSHTIFSDNERNFASKQIANFCSKYKIAHRFSTSYYPQGNGQPEINNRTILDSLNKSPGIAKGKWAEKLSGVLWAYRTTKRVLTGETSFSLAYGT